MKLEATKLCVFSKKLNVLRYMMIAMFQYLGHRMELRFENNLNDTSFYFIFNHLQKNIKFV